MSDFLQHEGGVALLRLRRPLNYFERKYGCTDYGFRKLAMLLEKQHHRGPHGAGAGCVNINSSPGEPFYQVAKRCGEWPLNELLSSIANELKSSKAYGGFRGDLYLGHLQFCRYGTLTLDACHPLVRDNFLRDQSLLMAGNFSLTNTAVLFERLVDLGYHLRSRQDSEILLTLLVHCLNKLPCIGSKRASFDLTGVLRQASKEWDGGFLVSGILGNGDAFALRDAHGIRPAYYYYNDEMAVLASERSAIQAAFDLSSAEVAELPPGHCFNIMRSGEIGIERCLDSAPVRRCVFERIYFSRGNDADIHRERRALGAALVPELLKSVNFDYENTVFSYLPDTAQSYYLGLLDELYSRNSKMGIRFAQIALKDNNFPSLITEPDLQRELLPHAFDLIYGVIRPGSDHLVVITDSIVHGRTIRNSFLPLVERLSPKSVVVASCTPLVEYPDCYGINMAGFDTLIAFEAALSWLKRDNQWGIFEECCELAAYDLEKPDSEIENRVLPIYQAIPQEELLEEVGRKLTPPNFKANLKVVFNSVDNLHNCLHDYLGDWYFTGSYPTPGGLRAVNRALVNFRRGLGNWHQGTP